MNEYITIENLKSWLENWKQTHKYYHPHSNPKTIPFSELEDILERIEREDVAPINHAKWALINYKTIGPIPLCSQCGWVITTFEMNYCPNCGAKMDGVLNERDVSDERRT